MEFLCSRAFSHLDFQCESVDLLVAVAESRPPSETGVSAMLTIHNDLGGYAVHPERWSTRTRGNAVLLAAVVGVGIVISALAMLASDSAEHGTQPAAACSGLAQRTERLVCYDNLAREPAPQPA